jgi:hypothetical protein
MPFIKHFQDLLKSSDAIGKYISLPEFGKESTMFSYACICVDLDLDKSLPENWTIWYVRTQTVHYKNEALDVDDNFVGGRPLEQKKNDGSLGQESFTSISKLKGNFSLQTTAKRKPS